MQQKEKAVFIGLVLGASGASLLGNMLAGKGTTRAGHRPYRTGEKI